MGKIDCFQELLKDNPDASLLELRLFADQLAAYVEASANIASQGIVCQHPRTSAPLVNPYWPIVLSLFKSLPRSRFKSDRVVKLLQAERLSQPRE